jgi:RNA polymerase sigma-70 factor, ECF subfamily
MNAHASQPASAPDQGPPEVGAARPALAHLAQRETGFLLMRALSHVRNSDEAWDLVQDTLVRALERPPRDLVPEKLRAWLLVVMRNLAIDQARRVSPIVSALVADGVDEPAAETDEPERARWKELDIEQLPGWVAALDPRLRTVFEQYAAGKSYRQIARHLGLPMATVGTRIFRAKRTLRKLLDSAARPPDAARVIDGVDGPTDAPKASSSEPGLLQGLFCKIRGKAVS